MRNKLRVALGVVIPATCVVVMTFAGGRADPPKTRRVEAPIPTRPKLAGTLRLHLRERTAMMDGTAKVSERAADWQVAETAIIVIDMWDDIYCKCAGQRIGVMVPRMNAVLTAARDHGAQIIHAPSGTVDIYADTHFRKRIKQSKPVDPPFDVSKWCYRDEKREPDLPLDVSKSPCDDPIPSEMVRKFTKQHPGLDMSGYDVVSDSGPEIYSFLRSEGIKNVAIVGVHTNMCVLGRPFGIRQLVKLGFNVALVRDLTDAMYDPREKPYVSHTRGTELVIEHIERYWCPSVASEELTRVVPGSTGPK
jgi:nicotinamidase-related amidase